MSSVTFRDPIASRNLVDQILEQGQRLRNAMVRAILNNDPFNSDFLDGKSFSSNKKVAVEASEKEKLSESSENCSKEEDKELLAAYIRGDTMSKHDENRALESFRNMSNTDISEFVERTSCACSTCKAYKEKLLENGEIPPLYLNSSNATTTRNSYPSFKSKEGSSARKILAQNESDVPFGPYFKYVDSLKISIHSLNLNQDGIKKVYGSTIDKKFQLPPSYSHTYFIDYTIPDTMLKAEQKSKAKVDSGLNLTNHVRMCSKKVVNKAIYFKQISFHDIKRLDETPLKDIEIKFQISCRTSKQKSSNILGVAKFYMSSFENTRYLTCNQEIGLMLNNETPILLGSLKVSLQLGCNRLYFGKEFIDAINMDAENNVVLSETLLDSDVETGVKSEEIHFNTNRESVTCRSENINSKSENLITSRRENLNLRNENSIARNVNFILERDTVNLRNNNFGSRNDNYNSGNSDFNSRNDNFNSRDNNFNTRDYNLSARNEDINSRNDHYNPRNYNSNPRNDNLNPRNEDSNLSNVNFNSRTNNYNTRSEYYITGRNEPISSSELIEPKSTVTGQVRNVNKKSPTTSRKFSPKKPERVPSPKIIAGATKKTIQFSVPLPSTQEKKSLQFTNVSPNLIPESSAYLINGEKQILFGFIYVSEAHALDKACNTYFTCQPFSQDDVFYSRLVYCNANPVYNFQETVPFLYDEAFLNRLRDNCMVFEFWEKCEETDSLIGICKIPLHQLYVAYRNPIIVKYLLTNDLPVICTDWWEPICDPISGRIYGQAQILIGLGSEEQIKNLQISRGFRTNVVRAKSNDYLIEAEIKNKSSGVQSTDSKSLSATEGHDGKKLTNSANTINKSISRKNIHSGYSSKLNRAPQTDIATSKLLNKNTTSKNEGLCDLVQPTKVDKSVQFNLKMDEDPQQPQPTDLLGAFLAQLMDKQKNATGETVSIENDSSTDNNLNALAVPQTQQNNSNMRKTSDLLESLQKALLEQPSRNNSTSNVAQSDAQNTHITQNTVGAENTCTTHNSNLNSVQNLNLVQNDMTHAQTNSKQSNKTSFKAHIIIDSAMHLPSRKKCKAKKAKSRNYKPEEILPSTYVSFETMPGCDLKITPIIQKSTHPTWDYRCDVLLPIDLITNNQKRLIFKVWRKCNGNSIQPNLQADMVLGFAAVDLTVLRTGLPTVQGWFNIVDLSSKCNGQIKINVTPLENVSKLSSSSTSLSPTSSTNSEQPGAGCGTHITNLFNNEIHISENTELSDEPSELLSRALKRKFIELDEITQRLRLRLSTVTNDESDVSNDELADEFERDINTLCVEDDYDTINFESITQNKEKNYENNGLLELQSNGTNNKQNLTSNQNNALLQFSISHNINKLGKQQQQPLVQQQQPLIQQQPILQQQNDPISSNMQALSIDISDISDHSNGDTEISNNKLPTLPTDIGILDQQLNEGKQRIASLLEKLSLITQSDTDPFSSRYVSGCSVSTQEAAQSNDILKELGIDNVTNIDPDTIINPMLFHELCAGSLQSTPLLQSQRSDNTNGLTSDVSTSSSGAYILNPLNDNVISSSSSSSVVSLVGSQFSRAAPDGAGNCAEENNSTSLTKNSS